MSALGAYDDRAAVGRRIGQARRELGLTQGALATRIGVTLGILDRYETGKADPSEKLAQIAEITARDVSWFTSADQYEIETAEDAAELATELGRRIAESRDLRGSTRRGPLDERLAATFGEPSSLLETGDRSAHEPDLADGSDEEPAALAKRLDELQAELAEERRKHGDAVAKTTRVQEEFERITAERQALADLLEQSRSELADARTQNEHLTQRASELETRAREAEKRATEAADRLGNVTTELERLREHMRSLAEELELRQAELTSRSAELDRRETAVADAETEYERRRSTSAPSPRSSNSARRCSEPIGRARPTRDRRRRRRDGIRAPSGARALPRRGTRASPVGAQRAVGRARPTRDRRRRRRDGIRAPSGTRALPGRGTRPSPQVAQHPVSRARQTRDRRRRCPEERRGPPARTRRRRAPRIGGRASRGSRYAYAKASWSTAQACSPACRAD